MDSSFPILRWPPPRSPPPWPSPQVQARLALSRAKHRSLTGHSKMSRRWRGWSRSTSSTSTTSSAPTMRRMTCDPAAGRLLPARGLYQRALRQGPKATTKRRTQISDLQFTEAYRVPFQYSRLVREHLGASAFVQSSSGVTVTDLDGNVSYDLTGSYGVNIFGNDFYKECIAGAKSAPMRSARCSAPTTPSSRQRQTAVRDFRSRRSLVPHVRHRGGHAGGAARALPHQAHASGSFRRRLSRLVGRRAARRRQPGVAARDLYACRHVRADAARPADAPRHRLRAGQSAAGAAPQRQCARRFRAGR